MIAKIQQGQTKLGSLDMESGDQDQFEQLSRCGHPHGKEEPLAEHVIILWRKALIIYFRRRGVPPDEAESLAQETLLRVIRNARLPENREEARRVVWGTARNVWLEWLRSHNPKTVAQLSDNDALSPPISVDVIEIRRWWQRVRKRIGDRKEKFVVDAFLRGLTVEELSEKYKISKNVVRQWQHRLKVRLRKEWRRDFGDYVPFCID